MTRYINPYTDFGFKKLFGEEASKELLIDFLNELLPIDHKIKKLSFQNSEQLGRVVTERKAIYDIYCEDEQGGKFIVEMQKAKLKFFKDRAVFYSTFPIREQADKGDWDFKLKPIYCVAILDFTFDDDRKRKDVITNVRLRDDYFQVFYEKLIYVFIEMPRFKKKESGLSSRIDKWIYFFKHLEDFQDIPEILKEDVFVKGFELAEIANYNPQQMREYEESLKVYRDLKGVIDTTYEDGLLEGEKKGIEKGRKEGEEKKARATARKMKKKNYSLEEIVELTGLSKEVIEKL